MTKPMQTTQQCLGSEEEVSRHVNQVLCQWENLEPGQFALTDRPLDLGGAPWGVLYCLHGPRSTRPTAVWQRERDLILFYDSAGQRFACTKLLGNPGDANALAS